MKNFIDYLKTKRNAYVKLLWANEMASLTCHQFKEASDDLVNAFDSAIEQLERENDPECYCHYECMPDGSLERIEQCGNCIEKIKNLLVIEDENND